MKKLLFSVAILAVAASCSKTEITEVATTAQDAIGFSTLNNLTRSANDAGAQYKVYAAQAGVTDAWYINGDNSKSGDDAELTNTYYWPVDGTSLDFYAYAPYTVTATATATSAISISYTVPTTADEDFTIAGSLLEKTENTVAFTFAHQLSKATVAVALTDELTSAGYELTMDTEVEAADAVYQEGYTADDGDDYIVTPAVEAVEAATVTLGVFGKTATYDVMGVKAIDYGTIPTELTTYKKDYDGNSFIFMPQSAEGCTIYVTGVTITDPSGKVIVDSKALATYTITEENLASFVQNYNYAITLTIDEKTLLEDDESIFGEAITFSADTKTWTEDNNTELSSDNQTEVDDSEEDPQV